MPTNVELQTLHDTSKLTIDASDSAELDEFHAFIRKDMPAYTLGQTTAASLPKFNGCSGVLIGTDNKDKRNTGGNLELQGVSAVDNIASWDVNIIGGNSQTSFSYDT
ncbi:hypothetical protein K469DRAFT_771995 [Zopfia rhizophila CBS 207.26]|uniref:Uncharacterized protein n=1 Tax=Zopfia rhizophila CBS 207.26 TaxID=1314779 RepID=A0A6A6E685_9PEZI|nr:hypothetical protein K469DRAFT_771995 [Zopfia rhizophila CBS 207.26]